jgi:hypothetical protein
VTQLIWFQPESLPKVRLPEIRAFELSALQNCASCDDSWTIRAGEIGVGEDRILKAGKRQIAAGQLRTLEIGVH